MWGLAVEVCDLSTRSKLYALCEGIAKGVQKPAMKGGVSVLFAFVHVCSRLLAFACVFASAFVRVCLRLLTFAYVCSHLLTPPFVAPPSA